MSDEVVGQIDKKTARDEFRAQFKNATAPDDFKDTQAFLRHATKLFQDDLSFDRENRLQAIEDAKFMAGDQWDNAVKQTRMAASKPTMAFNRLPAFVAQVLGNRRLNETDIKVIPDDASFKDAAKLREGLIRSIQKVSRADIAYNKANENQVTTGMGAFEVALEYAYDDVFEQDAKIKMISNPLSVVWDQTLEEPTGHDAKHVFVVDTMTKADFKREWPDGTAGDPSTDTKLLGVGVDTTWITEAEVRVVRMWRMRSVRRIVALLRNKDPEDLGEDVVDITDLPPEQYVDRLVTNEIGVPVMREVDRKFAQLMTFTATDLLEGPYDLPISRVPVFRVPGWEVNVGNERTRFGLIRFLKDPQRLHNYWRSIIAEKLMQTPKSSWIAADDAVEGRETEWRESHLSDDPLLIYNAESGRPPERVPPAQIEGGLIEAASQSAQDLRDISNLHEASLGISSNEVSGRAILARQRQGETGTVIYQDNLDLAIEACGSVLNELIPFVYNTARTIKVLGSDGEDLTPVVINDETSEGSVDITVGKYTVTSTTGPSFVTKRVEASESMLAMVNAMPDTLAIAADKIVEAQDWPEADKIAARLRAMLPPGVVDQADMSDEQLANQEAAAQQAQEQSQKENMLFELEILDKQAGVAEKQARATQAEAQAAKAIASIEIDQFKAIADVESSRVQNVLAGAKFFDDVTEDISGNADRGEIN